MGRRVSGVRSEKIDTRQVLLGHLGYANGTELARRRGEREAVLGYWPEGLLDGILSETYVAPPWTLLQRPTTWRDVPQGEVVVFVEAFIAEHRHWPRLDDLMKRFGKVSNHRTAGEAAGQEALL